MANIVNLVGVESAFNNVRLVLEDRAAAIATQRANEFCNVLNYQIGIVATEAMFGGTVGSEETSGEVLYYDPQHAEQISSNLLKNFADVFVAVVEDTDDKLSKHVVIHMPQNFTVSDLVISRLKMAIANAKRMMNINEAF